MLDTDISKLQSQAIENDNFYLRPLPSTSPDPRKPWYYSTPVGKNELFSMLKNMCLLAGVEGKKTNHSLRAIGATELLMAGAPEKNNPTTYCSNKALRVYERTTLEQHQAESNILSSDGSKQSFDNVLQDIQTVQSQYQTISSTISVSSTPCLGNWAVIHQSSFLIVEMYSNT